MKDHLLSLEGVSSDPPRVPAGPQNLQVSHRSVRIKSHNVVFICFYTDGTTSLLLLLLILLLLLLLLENMN